MIEFIVGTIVGGVVGVVIMALIQINHQNDGKN